MAPGADSGRGWRGARKPRVRYTAASMDHPDPEQVRRLVREAVERALGPEPGAARASAPAPAPRPVVAKCVAIGSDHGGYALKEVLKRAIAEDTGWQVRDCGTHSEEAVDYPDFAAAVSREVAAGRASFGIVVDAAGIGSTMAANKVPGVRCALCHDDATVRNAREHNDANVLALGARVVHRGAATRMVRLFLETPFGGGRHERRVRKIMALEREGRG
jgi:ribose 5-phosphate isomerase B